MAKEKAKEIPLGEDFGAVAITVNGKRIEVSAEGGIEIKPANSNTMTAIAAAQKAYEFGDVVQEGKYKGFLYVGISEDKKSIGYGEAMYMEARGTITTWHGGEDRARGFLSQGFERARQGTIEELLQINRDDIARQESGRPSIFNRYAMLPAAILWSSTPIINITARALSIPSGQKCEYFTGNRAMSQCLC